MIKTLTTWLHRLRYASQHQYHPNRSTVEQTWARRFTFPPLYLCER